MRCERCPREDESVQARIRAVPNRASVPAHAHRPMPTPFATEVVVLCDRCALVDECESVPLDEIEL